VQVGAFMPVEIGGAPYLATTELSI